MVPAVLDHNFTGPAFTLGIEEELMICDGETLELSQSIEQILHALPDDVQGYVKPELMQSVLEVATLSCSGVEEAGEQLRDLRRLVRGVAQEQGLAIGAAGTHPTRGTRTRRSSISPATGSLPPSWAGSPSRS
jgi:carboxylate-amine ligase